MTSKSAQNSFSARQTLPVGNRSYDFYSIPAAQKAGLPDASRLPVSLKVLIENLLRWEDGRTVTRQDIEAVARWADTGGGHQIAYHPARVLMQDFTGVPAVVDLAALRDAVQALGGDPRKINPLTAVDLVIDHSVMVDESANAGAFAANVAREYQRNRERYDFLRWGQAAFENFRVVPPGTGICHQVNLEYLAQVVWTGQVDGQTLAYPDTLVGTDSHTTMVNGLGVLGWGVGGIEAEAAMLGQPVSMLVPDVVGFRLTGRLPEGATATDLVLTVTQTLRQHGVVGKFVEFFGPGLAALSLPDRATISNMAPEYGATCGFFPIDAETLRYLAFTGRAHEQVALVEAYARAQGLWIDERSPEPIFTDTLSLDISTVEPSLAGPKRPQDRVLLSAASREFASALETLTSAGTNGGGTAIARSVQVPGTDYQLTDGDVVIAAITSCTNTSNPTVMVAAGLVARKAAARGLTVKPWVKTSLAPGSQVVTDYLVAAGLQEDLDTLGFQLVGYGCTTCIGNSGPLAEPIAQAIKNGDLVACSVLSGNRNFEGRVHPQVRANYLASPPLVVAYALAGSMQVDLKTQPLGVDTAGKPVMLADIWPTNDEVQATLRKALTPEMFQKRYANVFEGDAEWQAATATGSLTYAWDADSTYIQQPPYFQDMTRDVPALRNIATARVLALLGDSVTTDHISPAGSFPADGPAGKFLSEHGVPVAEFNSFGSRRGNHEIMMRGTFANIRLKNEMVPGVSGGFTRKLPEGNQTSIYEAAMAYLAEGTQLVVIAGKEYGTGSSRDWAAKGTRLLGVEAVIAESFERIHRSNLVGMGVLPLEFPTGVTRQTLGLDGSEVVDISGIEKGMKPGCTLSCTITDGDGKQQKVALRCRIDTEDELDYYRHGGILQYVLRRLVG